MSEKLRKFWTFSRNGGDSAPDPWLREALGALDPAERSPGYWGDFKRSVVLAARPELARCQRLAELTVSEVVFSWSRALVPAAMMAAARASRASSCKLWSMRSAISSRADSKALVAVRMTSGPNAEPSMIRRARMTTHFPHDAEGRSTIVRNEDRNN